MTHTAYVRTNITPPEPADESLSVGTVTQIAILKAALVRLESRAAEDAEEMAALIAEIAEQGPLNR